jgi:hypothetical protein
MSDKKNNNQIILEEIIKSNCQELDGNFSVGEYFEIFSASQILKNYDLTYDDIQSGVIGSGGDGGIDSIYTFVNGELLNEDTIVNPKQKKCNIELILIQSKATSATNHT